MAKVFGSKQWCLWCKSKDMAGAREIEFTQKYSSAPELLYVCSERCEQDLRAFLDLVNKRLGWFIASIVIWFVAMGIGVALGIAAGIGILVAPPLK